MEGAGNQGQPTKAKAGSSSTRAGGSGLSPAPSSLFALPQMPRMGLKEVEAPALRNTVEALNASNHEYHRSPHAHLDHLLLSSSSEEAQQQQLTVQSQGHQQPQFQDYSLFDNNGAPELEFPGEINERIQQSLLADPVPFPMPFKTSDDDFSHPPQEQQRELLSQSIAAASTATSSSRDDGAFDTTTSAQQQQRDALAPSNIWAWDSFANTNTDNQEEVPVAASLPNQHQQEGPISISQRTNQSFYDNQLMLSQQQLQLQQNDHQFEQLLQEQRIKDLMDLNKKQQENLKIQEEQLQRQRRELQLRDQEQLQQLRMELQGREQLQHLPSFLEEQHVTVPSQQAAAPPQATTARPSATTAERRQAEPLRQPPALFQPQQTYRTAQGPQNQGRGQSWRNGQL